MERRGRIPVAKFRTQESKTRSRSRVREPDYNEQDPETDLFTLLEDNIALKEENKELKQQIEDLKKTRGEAIEEKNRIREQLFSLERQQESSEMQIREFMGKLTKVNNERNALDKLHKMKTEAVSNLEQKLKTLQLGNSNDEIVNISNGKYLQADKSLREKLVKMLPNLSSHSELESLVDLEPTEAIAITNELVGRLVDEFFALKNSFNAVELQLYEANEKIAELIENQHHLEEESEVLRTENTNLTKVAKLLTENMKESVETSKKMETALIKLKQRNDELVAKSRDFIDGQSSENPSPAMTPTMEENPPISVEQQEDAHNERIVEMNTLLEAAIQKTTNDELKTLQLKLEILEAELHKTIERAELAENELEKYKIREQQQIQEQEKEEKQNATITTSNPPPPPPPPPPPLPVNLLYKGSTIKPNIAVGDGNTSFSSSIATHNINNPKENQKVIESVLHQVQPEAATGLDALVREFKSGRVTLRRNRRQTRTNPALQEMFDVLEISQKQNRNSKICIDLHK